MNKRMRDHWNHIYASNPVHQLGWYEEIPQPSLRLLARRQLVSDDALLDVGAGASTMTDCLIAQGYRNVIAADISPIALTRLKARLGAEKASRVRWIVDDVTQPTHLIELRDIALWHDRALLHFLLDEGQRQAYVSALKHVLRPGGYVILATFSLLGAKRCSGLEVKLYDQNMLAELLGKEFEMIEWFDAIHTMPSGEPRPYVYTRFRRNEAK